MNKIIAHKVGAMLTRTILLPLVILMLFACSTIIADDKAPGRSQSADLKSEKYHKTAPKEIKRRNYKPGEVLVKFRDGTDDQTIKTIQAELHLKIIKLVYKPNVYLMKILDHSSVESVIERLRNYGKVEYSEPNYVRRLY